MATTQQISPFEQQARAAIQKKNGVFGSSVAQGQAWALARHIAARSSEAEALNAIADAGSLAALIDYMQRLQPKPLPKATGAQPLTEPPQGTGERPGTAARTTGPQRPRATMESILTAFVDNLPQYAGDRKIQAKRAIMGEIERSQGNRARIQELLNGAIDAAGLQELLLRINSRRDANWAVPYEFHSVVLSDEETNFLRRFLELKPKEMEKFIGREERTLRKVAERLDRLAHLCPRPEEGRGVQYADLLKKRWGLDQQSMRGSLDMSGLLGCTAYEAKGRILEALFVFTDVAYRVDWDLTPAKMPALIWPDRARVEAILRGEQVEGANAATSASPASADSASPAESVGDEAASGRASDQAQPLDTKKILRALSLGPSRPRNLPQIKRAIAELKRTNVIDDLRSIAETPARDRRALCILELRYLSRADVRSYRAVAQDYSAENPTKQKINAAQAEILEADGLAFLQGYMDSI